MTPSATSCYSPPTCMSPERCSSHAASARSTSPTAMRHGSSMACAREDDVVFEAALAAARFRQAPSEDAALEAEQIAGLAPMAVAEGVGRLLAWRPSQRRAGC
jgi:hypothetical protein